MKNKKYLKFTYLKEITHDELDLVLDDEVFGVDPDGHEYDIIKEDRVNSYMRDETDEISIDTAIKTLEELKKAGSTHVQIAHHCDHHGFNFIGLEARQATQEEIDKHLNMWAKKNKQYKDEKIARLEKELEQLKK